MTYRVGQITTTRIGRMVRILAINARCEGPIVGLVTAQPNDGFSGEKLDCWYANGKHRCSTDFNHHIYDLHGCDETKSRWNLECYQ